MEHWWTYTGAIDPASVGNTIVGLQNLLLNYATNPVSKLTFFISSLGGDTDSAIRLYEYLTALPFPVHTVGFGQVYSAGVTIYLAGEKRFALKKTKFLIHEGIYTIGQPSAPMHLHDENLTILKEVGKRNIEILAERSGKTAAQIQSMMKDVKALSADQAKSAGFVTNIIEKLPTRPALPLNPTTPPNETPTPNLTS